MDSQQATLVATLEAAANNAEQSFHDASDRYDVARHYYRQPNQWLWKRHATALLVAGLISVGGVSLSLAQNNPISGIMGSGVGVAIGLVSKAMDDDRQTLEKDDRLFMAKQRLDQAEQALEDTVRRYRQEEELRWLALALDLTKPELLALQDWMADPRRSMKDALLEGVDRVSEHLLGQSLAAEPIPELLQERRHRLLKAKVLSPDLQLANQDFVATIAAKHTVRRQQSQQRSNRQAQRNQGLVAAGAATVVGMATGASLAQMATTTANTWQQSRGLMNALGTIGGAATVVGVGLLTAGALTSLMRQNEADRHQREERHYQAALAIVVDIHHRIVQLCHLSDPEAQRLQAKQILTVLTAAIQQDLKNQDAELVTFSKILHYRLMLYLGEPPDQGIVGNVANFLASLMPTHS